MSPTVAITQETSQDVIKNQDGTMWLIWQGETEANDLFVSMQNRFCHYW